MHTSLSLDNYQFMANLILSVPHLLCLSRVHIILKQIPDVVLIRLSIFQCMFLKDKIVFKKTENLTTMPFSHLKNTNNFKENKYLISLRILSACTSCLREVYPIIFLFRLQHSRYILSSIPALKLSQFKKFSSLTILLSFILYSERYSVPLKVTNNQGFFLSAQYILRGLF